MTTGSRSMKRRLCFRAASAISGPSFERMRETDSTSKLATLGANHASTLQGNGWPVSLTSSHLAYGEAVPTELREAEKYIRQSRCAAAFARRGSQLRQQELNRTSAESGTTSCSTLTPA
jgi:hypothetical protein